MAMKIDRRKITYRQTDDGFEASYPHQVGLAQAVSMTGSTKDEARDKLEDLLVRRFRFER